MPRPFHGNNNMVDMQNNGYKSTISAISEIVDNSIDWGATLVQIVLIRNTTRKHDEIDEILIIDDGVGMDMGIFNKALQSNAGANSGARKGLGKYGMGLPNASISVTRRTEVYTKTLHGNILFNYLDLIEMKSENLHKVLLDNRYKQYEQCKLLEKLILSSSTIIALTKGPNLNRQNEIICSF